MEHRATSQFWQHYHALQPPIRGSADKQFSLLEGNPQHPSLQFNKIGDRHGEEIYSARVTLSHRDVSGGRERVDRQPVTAPSRSRLSRIGAFLNR
jgi:hypothetical protein